MCIQGAMAEDVVVFGMEVICVNKTHIPANAVDVRFEGPDIKITDACFLGHKCIKSVQLPANLWIIEENWFSHCVSLEHVCWRDPVTRVVHKGFPPKLKRIKNGAFAGCIKLNTMLLPGGVCAIDDFAFSNCKAMAGVCVIPKSVSTLGTHAFAGCTCITAVVFEGHVNHLGDCAFVECKKLRHIVGAWPRHVGAAAFHSTGLVGSLCLPPTRIEQRAISWTRIHGVDLNRALDFNAKRIVEDCGQLAVVHVKSVLHSTHFKDQGVMVIENNWRLWKKCVTITRTSMQKLKSTDVLKEARQHAKLVAWCLHKCKGPRLHIDLVEYILGFIKIGDL